MINIKKHLIEYKKINDQGCNLRYGNKFWLYPEKRDSIDVGLYYTDGIHVLIDNISGNPINTLYKLFDKYKI